MRGKLEILSLALALGACAVMVAGGAAAQAGKADSCVACHGDADLFGEEGPALVNAFLTGDIHAEAGLSCHDCHGGNADPALADDMVAAMDPDFAEHPYVGVPERGDIPAFCGRCHSDPTYMRRFQPDPRVDQEREYWTSQHGVALAAGDSKVATCVDCHGVHGMRAVGHNDSPVYPTRVAETCRRCHGDGEYMAGYTTAAGRPLPTDQFAGWRRSVHAAALLDRGDLSAPTCNDCHGNHGATPPGLDSITYVCGQCHGREASLFRDSVKEAGFQLHNELLEGTGEMGCAACHAPPEPQGEITDIHTFSECASCHRNHSIFRPTMAMLSPLPEAPCVFCHGGSGGDEAEPEASRRRFETARGELLAEGAALGLEGETLFNWLVERSLELPQHTVEGAEEAAAGEGGPPLRPEFERLFTKFRIGKTYNTYPDPDTGEEVRVDVVRCEGCHAAEPLLAAEPAGLRVSERMVERMTELTTLTARAERLLLLARRGGVEVRSVLPEIDAAVSAQIELEVLVHTFAVDEDGAFAEKHLEGVGHAGAALAAGRESLKELGFRRRGLGLALIFILLVALGLFLKIRQLSRRAGG